MTHTIFLNSTKNNTFCPIYTKKTDYSEILDSLISSNIKKTNPYLSTDNDTLIDGMILDAKISNAIKFSKALKDSDIFAKATEFIYGFIKPKTKLPYILGHKYYINGSTIIFHDDSIEIDGTEYYYDDFNNNNILKNLTKKNKKIIIDIYLKGFSKIGINIS